MKKMLIVEDDPTINTLLREIFEQQSFLITSAFSGTEALLLIKQQRFDIVLLDLMLPGMTGEVFLKEFRDVQQTPVIIVSAKSEVMDKVSVLRLGADDFITKPFAKEELIARVEVQLRKKQVEQVEATLSWRDLSIDIKKHMLFIQQQPLQVTNAEFDILRLFLEAPEQVFSKKQIYEKIWNDTYYGDDNTVGVHISNLRKKLANYTTDEYIKTVWGIGFMLV
ncbi:response regulator transcription factor [Enterococcus sp. LJL99]